MCLPACIHACIACMPLCCLHISLSRAVNLLSFPPSLPPLPSIPPSPSLPSPSFFLPCALTHPPALPVSVTLYFSRSLHTPFFSTSTLYDSESQGFLSPSLSTVSVRGCPAKLYRTCYCTSSELSPVRLGISCELCSVVRIPLSSVRGSPATKCIFRYVLIFLCVYAYMLRCIDTCLFMRVQGYLCVRLIQGCVQVVAQ